MELNIFLINEQDYYIKNVSLPIILKVTSELKLAKKLDVKKIIFTKDSEVVKSFFSAEASYLNKEFWTMSNKEAKSKYFIIDLSQYKDSLVSLAPDEYQINIEALLYEENDGEYKIHNLQAKSNITLK